MKIDTLILLLRIYEMRLANNRTVYFYRDPDSWLSLSFGDELPNHSLRSLVFASLFVHLLVLFLASSLTFRQEINVNHLWDLEQT